MVDESTRNTLKNIPLLKTKAGPRDKNLWSQRLKEEYLSLIKVSTNFFCIFSIEKIPFLNKTKDIQN